ncbi:YIP1 family protein [Lihuaxuella thermophila]|uniref:Yip1 domain-containing protein n=1 Tax=Lihuaxuella thermophila TaxID=1173111 RepID=A0A1H8ILJ7_9BACL|nr:YIP1 family protein [Lihuaxuella thermophila]SEN68807.1 Yip1 domain-containing protein [Lihuaxuella thermophila]
MMGFLSFVLKEPRQTLRDILESSFSTFMWLAPLAFLGGIYDMFDNSIRVSNGDKMSLMEIIILCMGFGIIWGVLSWLLEAALLLGFGRLFSGTATWRDTLTATAWGRAPLVISLLLFFLPMMLTFGVGMFQSESPTNAVQDVLGFLYTVIYLVLFVFYYYLNSHFVAEVHEFASAWKGFGVFILSKLVYFIVIVLLFLLVGL